MRYIDSSIRSADETAAHWMSQAVQEDIREVRFQSGYFTQEGLGVLLPALRKSADNAVIRLLIGSNDGTTTASHVAFVAGALGIPRDNISIGIVRFERSLFHPKVYHIVRADGSQTAYVGSANLTGPGLAGENIEAGIVLDTREADTPGTLEKISTTIDAWFATESNGLFIINGATDIENLLNSGHLSFISPAERRNTGPRGPGGDRAGSYLPPLFKLPPLERTDSSRAEPNSLGDIQNHVPSSIARHRLLRNTEASFHYPQGTHPGHLLAVLQSFAEGRENTAFDDEYIRLHGSFGQGRLAAFRRQIKYKLLAAIELGLVTDPRTLEDPANFRPELTQTGQRIWSLLKSHFTPSDLIIEAAEEDGLSTKMPKSASFYIEKIRFAQENSEELRDTLLRVTLNMPAVTQLLQLLYHQERASTVSKIRIYETYFESAPVQAFCNEMGIEPATREGARHRCPFLINLLETCSILTQDSSYVKLDKLALSPSLMIRENRHDDELATRRFRAVAASWPNPPADLSKNDLRELRELFGNEFLTPTYSLKQLVTTPQ